MSFASTELALSHAELLSCLLAEGTETTFFVVGAPGIGKSSILRQLPDYTPVMVDCAQFEPGDLMLPVVSEDKTTVRYALHDILQMHSGRPIAICLDELAKAAPSVQASLLPLIYERRLGSTRVPGGSIVFGTSNEDEDGVGDALHAHAWNRLCPVVLRAPSPEEWMEWATPAGVAPEIVAFARAYPAMFEHYSSPGSESNPYIFNPKTGRTRSYVSPRSLARCTPTVRARHAGTITVNAAQATLSGKIGSAAAAEAIRRSAGMGSSSTKRALLDANVKPLPWTTIFRNAFRALTAANAPHTTWSRPNRRAMARGDMLPGYARLAKLGPIVVVGDTSASIGHSELSDAAAQVGHIISQTPPSRLTVLWVDAAVKSAQVFEPKDYRDLRTKLRPVGGGGTNVRVAFDYIAEQGMNPMGVVVFTDGYTPLPEKELPYPVWWVITTRHIESPTGKTIHWVR